MWALFARYFGQAITNQAVRRAAQTIFRSDGPAALKEFGQLFLKNAQSQNLLAMSADDLVAFFRANSSKTANTMFGSRAVPGAKKFASFINRGIDKVEDVAKSHVERRRIDRIQAQIKDFDALGPRPAKTMGSRAQGVAEAMFLPITKGQAFGSGFARGVTGETVAQTVNRLISVLIAAPRGTLRTPAFRKFLRTLEAEVKYLRSIGDISNAKKLHNAIQTAYRAAKKDSLQPPDLLKFSAAGNVSGRVTVVASTSFVFVDDETRQQNFDRFKKTVMPYAREQMTIHIESYTRRDGTKVKAHNRKIEVAA